MRARREATDAFVSFELAGSRWAIAVEHVLEVVRAAPLTPLPLAPPPFAGVIPLRSRIVPALDLRVALGFPPRAQNVAAPMHLLVRRGRSPVGLIVDRVGDLVRVPRRQVHPPPESLPPLRRARLLGAATLEDGLLGLIDIERMLEVAFAAPAPGRTASPLPEAP